MPEISGSLHVRHGLKWQSGGAGSFDQAEAQFTVDSATGFGYLTNGVELAGQLPYVLVMNGEAPSKSKSKLFVTYQIPSVKEFAWPSTRVPFKEPFSDDRVTWFSETYVEGDAASNPETFSVVNRSEQRFDSIRTFIAGAVVGIAGGAFVGGLQEVLHGRRPSPQRLQAKRGDVEVHGAMD